MRYRWGISGIRPGVICLVVALLAFSAVGSEDKPAERPDSLQGLFGSMTAARFEFLPQFYLLTDISIFGLHKDSVFKRNYLAEWNTRLSFEMISYNKRWYGLVDTDFHVGLGEVPGNIVFTILNVDFALTPVVEYRLESCWLAAGLEHRCFHEVDRVDYGIVHWNRLYGQAGSVNSRINAFWAPIALDKQWELSDRLSWQIQAGYYLKEFFGLVSPGKLNGKNDAVFDFDITSRFAFYRRRSWVLAAISRTRAGVWKEPLSKDIRGLWRQETGVEAFFRRGNRGGSLYLQYILDDLPPVDGRPRFSKDRLLEFGIHLFN